MKFKLLPPEEMDENHLLNTIKLNIDDMSLDRKAAWNTRKDECRMELIKRWVPHLQQRGYKAKIITKEPEGDKATKSYGSEKPKSISVDDLLNELDLFSK